MSLAKLTANETPRDAMIIATGYVCESLRQDGQPEDAAEFDRIAEERKQSFDDAIETLKLIALRLRSCRLTTDNPTLAMAYRAANELIQKHDRFLVR